jgi:hypothetical protein
MVADPADRPVTSPPALTDAIDGLELLHAPPGVLLFRVATSPRQIEAIPVIALSGLTVIEAVAMQPAGVV